MPLTVPALREIDRVAKAASQLQTARRNADEAARAYSDARQKVQRLSMSLARAQADEMLGEPGDDPKQVRADLATAKKVEAEARERAQETVLMLDALTARAPDVWETVHEEHKRDAFREFADRLDRAADALESCLEALDEVTDAQHGSRWLDIAADQLGFPAWITKEKKQSGSNARRWIDKARERAARLRDEPHTLGTGYSQTLRKMRQDAEQIGTRSATRNGS